MHRTTRIDVSTKAAVIHYLRSIHVSAKGVVIQRGLRNYAGAHCPGKGWTCASTRHTVVQIAKRGGLNRFACRTVKCAVVQFGGASRGLRSFAASRAPKPPPPPNTALCVKTTGVTQSCVINQPNASGTNQAVVWMVTPKNTGLTQSSYYSASITQGPPSAASSSNNNIACVNQFVWLDGSTTKTNTAGTTVTNDNHELITINQNSLTGNNTVQGAKTTNTAGTAYDCDATQPLTQGELLTSIVNSKGSITQNQNTQPSTTNCDPYDANVPGCANVVTDIEQNQNLAGGFKGSASGVNIANFAQSTRQIAVANTPSGTVTQQQNANVPAAPYSGVVGTINQDSTAQSTAVVTQDETQCQDSVSQSTPIPAPTSSATTGSGSAACPAAGDQGVPSGVTLKQTQYGPLGVGTPLKKKRGPVFSHTKGYGQSQQTNAQSPAVDQFKLTQTSSQKQDEPGPKVTLKQVNTIKGDCASSGNGSPIGGACDFSQSATLNGVTNGTTTDGYTAGQIGGTGTGAPPPLVITCTNGHDTCKPTPPPAPTLTTQVPDKVTEATTAQFGWTDLAKNNTVTYQCKISNSSYSTFAPCSPGDTFTGLGVGTHTFTVNALDASQNVSTPDTTYTWNIVDANVSVASDGVSEVGTSQQLTITTNALPAGTTSSLPTITPHFSPTPETTPVSTCGSPTITTDKATCTVTINSTSAAAITVTATATWHFSDGTNSANVSRDTDGTHGSNSGATARFVDANTSVSPDGVTEVGHSQTVTVTTNALPAAGTTASLTSITPHFSSTPDHETDTCGTPTTGTNTASCTVTITNDTASTVTVTATAVWHFTDGTNPADVTRATDGTHGSSNGATAQFTANPPTPVIDTGPQDGNSGDAPFTFHDSDSLLTFLCSTDGTNYSGSTCNTGAGPGTGSATVSSPPTGSNTFYVEATDGTNVSLPTSWTWMQAS